jgi:Pentapeptide repeats (8 copies)
MTSSLRQHKGLRKLSPDQIDKASDDTAAQVNRILLTFVATAAFCLLSLFSPDVGLISGGTEKLNVPGAGPVSFFGFMLLGPTVLIVLRIYLQIYVEHGNRLERIAQRMPVVRAPTLLPLKNPLMRGFSGLCFYLLLPGAMLLFAWKAAVFPAWGSGLLCVAAAVIVGHALLPLRRISWRSKAVLSVTAAILAAGLMLGFGPVRRPFELHRANLSGQQFVGYDLRNAELLDADLHGTHLVFANLESAVLSYANLSGAFLVGANLRGAFLFGANLRGADLRGADLTGAQVHGSDLRETNLRKANLSGVNVDYSNLSGADLRDAELGSEPRFRKACGTDANLPLGLILKPCPLNWSTMTIRTLPID